MTACSKKMNRKTLLYKTGVEYGDYTINHVLGCSHGCKYPCYAMMMAKRFGKVKTYKEWCNPKICENTFEILEKEIPKLKSKISSVHLSFTTDPFMYGYKDIAKMSLKILRVLNEANIKCTVLTKGTLPISLTKLSEDNEYGITLISLDEKFRKEMEPGSAPYKKRISSLEKLHNSGCKTWVSIEPYPTPNIITQDFIKILNAVSFVDKIIFGRLHYNKMVTSYKGYQEYYNELCCVLIDFCKKNNIEYIIKKGTMK